MPLSLDAVLALSPDESSTKAQAQAKAQNQTERCWQRMAAGVAELQRWLVDKLRQGLGSTGPAVEHLGHPPACIGPSLAAP